MLKQRTALISQDQKNCASKIFSRVVIIATTMKAIPLQLNCGRYDTGTSVNELVVDHNIYNMKKMRGYK